MQWVQANVGGILHLDVIDVEEIGVLWDSTPVPTVTLYHRNGGELRASASATLGATCALSTAATAASRTISLATTAGITRGAQLLLKASAGPWEWITPESVSAGVVTLREPLENSYADNSSVRSPRLKTTVAASTCTESQHGCFAKWCFTAGGSAREEYSTFTISRYVPRLNVSAQDITAQDARATTLIGSDQELDALIRSTWDRRVLLDTTRLLGTPGAIIAGESLDSALILRVLADLYLKAGALDIHDRYEAQYAQAIDGIRSSVVDLDESGGQSDDEAPRSRRSVRVFRG